MYSIVYLTGLKVRKSLTVHNDTNMPLDASGAMETALREKEKDEKTQDLGGVKWNKLTQTDCKWPKRHIQTLCFFWRANRQLTAEDLKLYQKFDCASATVRIYILAAAFILRLRHLKYLGKLKGIAQTSAFTQRVFLWICQWNSLFDTTVQGFLSAFNLCEIVCLNENYMTRIKCSPFMNGTYFFILQCGSLA